MELTADELWSRISDAARDVLPEQTYRTWLSSAEAITLSDDDGTLVVGAPTKFAVEWIEDKYGSLLSELAEKEVGRSVSLAFEHKGDGDRMEFPEIGGQEGGDGAGDAAPSTGAAPAEETDAGEVGLNERYTFDRFVIGTNNQLAAAACQRVADAPAQAYNPLFIYGDTGLGKTHLMHAIGHAILEREPDRRVAYIPSERFTNEMIAAIQSGRTAQFRQR
ncbi:MAG: DnaA ATPase domain-containing protein, partial [Gemmatimonadota bacterium]